MEPRGVALTLAGVFLILLALTDVFHTLLYPRGTGPVCRPIIRFVWRLAGFAGTRARTVAGPAAMSAVIGAWAALAVVGWALLYLPHLPEGFAYQNGVQARGDFAEAVYLSAVSLSTAGFGDITPSGPLLRLVTSLQAVTGFALLTAAVSWILQIYPALRRRRALAHHLSLLREELAGSGFEALAPPLVAGLLHSLAERVISAGVDLVQFDETYYFHEPDERSSLPATLAHAERLASMAGQSANADVRFAGHLLEAALTDLAKVLRRDFRHTGDTVTDIFASYARHHGHPVGDRPATGHEEG